MLFTLASPHEILAELGARLRASRLSQSLTQADLGAMAGVSVGTIQILERTGKSSMETFVRVVQALGMVDELQPTFVPKRSSIEAMRRADAASHRQRAPRKQSR